MKKKFFTKKIVFALLILIFALLYWSCSEDANPLPSKAHTEAWSNPRSENFHGAKVFAVGDESCKICHGADYMGGDSKVSCYGSECHSSFPHAQEWLVMSSQMSHGNYIRKNGWSMENCVNCHGEDYEGGASGAACNKCHQHGPEACNVCHGNNEHIHPPEDLKNNIETSALGVGAHEIHLARFDCSLCHSVPDGFDDPAHIDLPPAEVKEQWTWDREAATCVTFCHGPELVWNDF